MVSRILTLSTGVAIALFSQSSWADISARVDKTKFGAGEPVELIVDVTQAATGAQLDLSSLQGLFTLVGSSQRSSTQIINGRSHSSRELVLSLMPAASGKMQIPPITLGPDSSEPVDIEVSDDAASGTDSDLISQGNLYLESKLSREQVYVQQPLLYTLDLYRKVSIYQPQVLPPEVLEGDALIEAVGEPREFRTQVNGEAYILHQIQFSVTPQQSGTLKLGPARVIAQVDSGQRQSRFPGTSLFADDFFSSAFSGFDRKQVRLRSQKVEVEIKAIPSAFKGNDWLPAEQVTLDEVWEKQQPWQAGTPMTRKITLQAEGVTASQLPELQLADVDGVSQYVSAPVTEQQWQDGTLISRSVTEITYIPQFGGQMRLPEVKQSWWNVKHNRAETALLASQSIQVNGAPAAGMQRPAANIQSAANGMKAETEPGTQSSSDAGSAQQRVAPVTGLSFWKREFGEIWGVVLSLLVIGLLFAMSLFRKTQKRPAEKKPDSWQEDKATVGVEQSAALKLVKKACDNNDPRRAREALIALLPSLSSGQTLTNLNQLSTLLGSDGGDAIRDLNQALFSPTGKHWLGGDLWKVVDAYVSAQRSSFEQGSSKLAPLHLS